MEQFHFSAPENITAGDCRGLVERRFHPSSEEPSAFGHIRSSLCMPSKDFPLASSNISTKIAQSELSTRQNTIHSLQPGAVYGPLVAIHAAHHKCHVLR